MGINCGKLIGIYLYTPNKAQPRYQRTKTNEQKKLSHPPDTPIPEMTSLTEKKTREGQTVGGWRMSRRGEKLHLSLLEKDNSTASIKLIN